MKNVTSKQLQEVLDLKQTILEMAEDARYRLGLASEKADVSLETEILENAMTALSDEKKEASRSYCIKLLTVYRIALGIAEDFGSAV